MAGLTEVADGVLVRTSELFVTTTTVVVGPGGECLLIDPAVTVADLAALAADLAGRGLRPSAAWSTHPHWDHVLWSQALGDAPRYAAPAAVALAETNRELVLSSTQEAAPGHDLDLVGRLVPLESGTVPWDGPPAWVIVHDGHAPGHGAVFLPRTGTLVAGDMCSDIEIPLLDLTGTAPLGDYRTGVARLGALPGVRQVVPGHGHVGDEAEFRRRLAADTRYLDALERGEPGDDERMTQDWLVSVHDSQVRFASRAALGGQGT